MNGLDLPDQIIAKIPHHLPRSILALLGLLTAAGGVTFILGTSIFGSLRVWEVFLVNLLFWSGIAQAGIILSAILHMTNAQWGRPIKRIAEGMASFLPVSFVLFLILFFGRSALFPWISHSIPEKEAWLNVPFLFVRDGVGLFVLYGLSLLFLYYSLRPDLGGAREEGAPKRRGLYWMLTSNWRGTEEETHRSQHLLGILAPIITILYTLVFSLIAFDLVMSLSPHWYSTLFGVYFFTGNLYLGLAAITVLSVMARKYQKLEAYVTFAQFHDLGKMILGFCMLTLDFFFCQFLVIWYGNLPEETEYIFRRMREMPWAVLSWAVLIVCFVIPFSLLISRKVKRSPRALLTISAVVLVGMWAERYLLVVPSLWHEGTFPFGWVEILITGGFLGAFGLTFLAFVRSFPILPITDPLLSTDFSADHISVYRPTGSDP